MENPIKMDDLGGNTPIFRNFHLDVRRSSCLPQEIAGIARLAHHGRGALHTALDVIQHGSPGDPPLKVGDFKNVEICYLVGG